MVGHRNNAQHVTSISVQQLTRKMEQVLETSNLNAGNSSRYKTELCRPYEESGRCKYGEKCQFAHGSQELRILTRHPKYKTEPCKTFHNTGFCPYGPRCHFIHSSDKSNSLQNPTTSFTTRFQPSLVPTHPLHIPTQSVPPLVRPRNFSLGECTTASYNTESQSSSLSNSPLLNGCFDEFVLDPLSKNAPFFFTGAIAPSQQEVKVEPSTTGVDVEDEVFWFSPFVLQDSTGYGSMPPLTLPHSRPH